MFLAQRIPSPNNDRGFSQWVYGKGWETKMISRAGLFWYCCKVWNKMSVKSSLCIDMKVGWEWNRDWCIIDYTCYSARVFSNILWNCLLKSVLLSYQMWAKFSVQYFMLGIRYYFLSYKYKAENWPWRYCLF